MEACEKCKSFPVNCKCEEIRLQAENKNLKGLLRYFLELPDRGIGDIETHRDKIKEAEEALKGK